MIRSRSAGDARPVRMLLNSVWVASIDLSIRRLASARNSSIAAIPLLLLPTLSLLVRGRDDRADALARRNPADVAFRQLEDVDRQAVVHAERQRGGVHDLQPALDRLDVRELGDELRVRVL